jgi:hypothetical protein
MGSRRELLEVGTFIVTFQDEAANCRWRRKMKFQDTGAVPMVNMEDEKYPEAWRISKIPIQQPHFHLKTVCRIAEIIVNNDHKGFAKYFPVASGDVALKVIVYARPADIGEEHSCPYEVIETDQGELHDLIKKTFAGVSELSRVSH